LNIFLDAVFPPKCIVCNRLFKPTTKELGIGQLPNDATEITDLFAESYRLLTFFCCSDCVTAFAAISSPMCTCCGIPFKSRQDEDHLCGDCISSPKKFRMARAAMAYDQQLMAVIHRFKYAAKTQLARPLGGLMLSVFMRQWDGGKVDLILPVPLHPQKIRSRGFNQSYLLIRGWKAVAKAMHIALSDIPIPTDVITRSKATVPQTGLGRRQRLKNVKGVFSLRFPEKIYGKKVLLVDDVYTTGATVNECARLLLKFGAVQVDVLTLARAV
jgi:ComF family protein